MSRKPKLGPIILRIERLSDGAVQPTNGPMVDDFTGQRIDSALPMPMAVPRPLLTGPELALERKRKRIADQRLMLQSLGILPKSDSALQEPNAVLGANQRMLGSALVMTIPRKPFRRV